MMKNDKYIESMKEQLELLRKQRLQVNYEARIALLFMTIFNRVHLNLLANSTEKMVVLTREMVVPKPRSYELRQCMNNDCNNEVVHNGY